MKNKKSKNNLEQRLKFLEKIDGFKNIKRHTSVMGRQARENDAEHTWHMAMWFLVFRDLFGKGINREKILEMILIHDLPEIYVGDTPTYAVNKKKKEKEAKGADRIFSGLPLKLGREYLKLWKEYELGKTNEAKIAKSIDKLQPFLQSIATKGKLWKDYKITYDMIDGNKRKHMEHDKNMMAIYENLLKKAEKILKNQVVR